MASTSNIDIRITNNEGICEEGAIIRVKDKHEIVVSLLLKEDALAPLFSGAAWAGTVVWDAAVALCDYVLDTYSEDLKNSIVLELGAGIGVPGMVTAIEGASKVYLTEQEDLVPLLQDNINSNKLKFDEFNAAVHSEVLSWGCQEVKEFQHHNCIDKIDFVLACDCVYEPLYGDSWKLLGDTLLELAISHSNAIVLVSVERRNADGVDDFVKYIESKLPFLMKKVWVPLKYNMKIEIYQLIRDII